MGARLKKLAKKTLNGIGTGSGKVATVADRLANVSKKKVRMNKFLKKTAKIGFRFGNWAFLHADRLDPLGRKSFAFEKVQHFEALEQRAWKAFWNELNRLSPKGGLEHVTQVWMHQKQYQNILRELKRQKLLTKSLQAHLNGIKTAEAGKQKWEKEHEAALDALANKGGKK